MSLRALVGIVVAAVTGLAAVITASSTIQLAICNVTGVLCPSSGIAFATVHTAEIQVARVDDFMQVFVNGQQVENAKFGDTPPWRSIKSLLRQGPNSILVNIDNGQYGGCGGTLQLRINGSLIPDFSQQWAIPMQQAPVNGNCVRQVLTLDLN